MKRHVSSVHRPPLWLGHVCLALAVILLSSSIGGPRAAAFGGLTDEAILVWQHRDSSTSATGWDIWYSVVGRATSGGSLSLHAGTTTGTQAAPIATLSGDDKNPHVSTNSGVTIAAWQHHHTNSTDIFYSTFAVVSGVPTWSTPAAIATASSSEHNFDPNVVVDSDGNAIAVWVHQHSTGARELQYSVFNGSTWSTPASIGASGGKASLPEVTVSSVSSVTGSLLAHRAVAAWSDVISATGPHRMFYSIFNGTSWTTPAQIENPSTTGVAVSIFNVVFANYSATDPDPYGAFGRVGLTADGFGKAYVVWSGGPTILGFFSDGVVGAILDVSANTWTAMLTPSGSRFIGIGGCENPDDALTTGGGDFIGIFSFAQFIEHTRRVGGTFTGEEFSYSSARDDQRPSNAAVSASEMISVNWGAPVGAGSTIVWAVGTISTGSVTWSSPLNVTVSGENMFPEIASGFAASLVTGFSLAPGTATNPVGTSHTVTATATLNGVPQPGITVNFNVTGANTTSGSAVTNSAGQATFTYTGTNAGTDTITAKATIGGAPQTATASKTWTAAAVDNIAPTTTAARNPAPNAAGWNKTDVTVTFTATDSAPTGVTPSGVASITVTDNGVPVPCSLTSTSAGSACTVVFSTEAHHHISYFATDNAGNAETAKMLDVMIDKTPPAPVSQTFTPLEDTPLTTIILTANDPGSAPSGVLSFSLASLPSKGTLTGTPPNLSYTPFADSNDNSPPVGPDSFQVTATDVAGNKSAPVTVFVSVTPVNDKPFFDPIPDQFVNPPLNANQTVSITGVAAGPPNEAEQTVAFTATSSNPALISNLTVTGTNSTRTLTYQRVSNGNGTVTITVTANDGQSANNTFARTFTITLGLAASNAVQASVTGFSPNTVEVQITACPIDFNGDGVPDRYFFFRPRPAPSQPFNVIPSNADRVPEAPPWRVPGATGPGDTVEISTVCQTFQAVLDLSEWITTPGTNTTDIAYVSIVRDLECILDPTTCVGPIWTGIKPVGSLTYTTGHTVVDKNTVTLHTVNIGGGASTKAPLAGAQVRVFDRNNTDFRCLVGVLTGKPCEDPSNKNPDGSLYGMIWNAGTADGVKGRVGSCTTDSTGICIASEAQVGDYLVIVRFADSNGEVFVGRPKSPTDFVNGVAEKDFQIMKVFKNGMFQGFRGGSKTTMPGSILEMIVPESAIWEGTQSIYPFIFTSDSNWTVDVCAQVPLGYSIVGVYDESGNLISSTNCAQTFVAGQTKIIAFEVVKTGSPEPSLDAELTIEAPDGKIHVKKVRASDIRKATFDAEVAKVKAQK